MTGRRPRFGGWCLLAALVCGQSAAADESPAPDTEPWNVKFQATWVRQIKPAFDAAYSGPNSLSARRETSYSFTATAALGFRAPWDGGEIYLNPEVSQGVPLSRLSGLGALTNGEMARTSGANLQLYHARMFVRQTWGLGGGSDAVASGMNQLAGSADRRRVVLTLGNVSVLDIFDGNAFSHDPRTQFLNWTLMTHGAYDYPADARGYSWGGAIEVFHDDWAVRAGRFAQPKLPNQLELDAHLLRHYGDQVELQHAHTVYGQPGTLRLLAFRNRTPMARFGDAMDLARATGGVPTLDSVRGPERIRFGGGINLEQNLASDLGAFVRASWSNGRTETYAFTEVDRSLSGGVVMAGARWGRSADRVGVAAVRNGLSADRRKYLESGGISFFIGDGALNYGAETVVETYYSLAAGHHFWITLDAQRIWNPAYNRDRGPVNVGSLRLHLEM